MVNRSNKINTNSYSSTLNIPPITSGGIDKNPNKSLICNKCSTLNNRPFSNKYNLNRHNKTMHGANGGIVTKKCNFCPLIFCRKNQLEKHEQLVHPNGEKGISCFVCFGAFSSNYARNQHIKVVHAKVTPPPTKKPKVQINVAPTNDEE